MRENADRFEGLAETYDLYRPGYPVAAFADLLPDIQSRPRVAVDVGAGTGLSTEALRQAVGAGWTVVALEPGADMRRVLARRYAETRAVQAMDGCAEDIPLAPGSASLVTACTAYHWFEQEAFHAEAARVLAPGGVLAVIRNRRKAAPVVQALDDFIAAHNCEIADYKARERGKEPTVRMMAALPDFQLARSRTYEWESELDARGLIDLYLTRSTTSGVVRRLGLRRVMTAFSERIAAEAGDGPIRLDWETTVKSARRRG